MIKDIDNEEKRKKVDDAMNMVVGILGDNEYFDGKLPEFDIKKWI